MIMGKHTLDAARRQVEKELKPLRDAIENSSGKWKLPQDKDRKAMTMLDELISRLEKAENGSRELNRAIHEATNKPLRPGFQFGHIPKYTESLDDAVAFVERVLPDWQYGVEIWRPANGGCVAWVAPNMESRRTRGATPALALVLAALKAMKANEV
jgi:hypothetical protein